MVRGAWQAAVLGVGKESDTTDRAPKHTTRVTVLSAQFSVFHYRHNVVQSCLEFVLLN